MNEETMMKKVESAAKVDQIMGQALHDIFKTDIDPLQGTIMFVKWALFGADNCRPSASRSKQVGIQTLRNYFHFFISSMEEEGDHNE